MKALLLLVFCLTAPLLRAEVVNASNPVQGQSGGGSTPSGWKDPTSNVLDLVSQQVKRLDDLRDQAEKFTREINALADKRMDDLRAAESRRLDEEAVMRSESVRELAVKEASRLDAIREVDRQDVSKTAAQANLAIANLAKQTTDLATTLAKQVTETATATETRFSLFQGETNKRISSLESQQSERQGKSTVSDPQTEQNRLLLEKVAAAQVESAGKSAGSNQLWVLIMGGVILMVAVASFLKSNQNGRYMKAKGG